ncbi:uncharacterized protein DNG_08375 [Cephalotrichum gorgonifer]|uniref:Uncharacterized protein n=1 Tax=Cephalotrichum gorgonifer TaxID=2041049 RepID=A0AAE8N5H4_9PEZI|nr:uncharacterized protein DNG_08375 [Cephalotrichum gorgonifer]
MGLPSRPRPVYYAPPPRASTFNPSLRLPPLQIQSPPLAGDSARYVSPLDVAMSRGTDSQVGVGAMIMSIPYLNKIETLCRICPALQVPHPGSPRTETRGALIAIEGPRPEMLRMVAGAVERMLSGSEDIVLKKWGDDDSSPRAEEAGMANRGSSWRFKPHAEASRYCMSYFGRMTRWHERSNEIIQHITTQPGPMPDDATAGGRSRSTTWLAETLASTSNTRVPVALVTTGFSLTWSDKFACAMPIIDSYAPVDHWTWVATFWRGIVGPDLFIYVKPSSEEDIRKFGNIEVKSNGIMVVRIDERREMDEMTERRLVFETVEWVRGGTYKTSF